MRLNESFKKFHINPYYRNLIKDSAKKKMRQSLLRATKKYPIAMF